MSVRKSIALALTLLHVYWGAAPALAAGFSMPTPERTPLAELPGVDRLIIQHPGIADALEHVATGPGSDVDGSIRIWQIALVEEGARQLDDWTAGPEEWVPLFLTEYNGEATLISIRPEAGEEGAYEGSWTYADGSDVKDENGMPIPQPEIYVENDQPDAFWLPVLIVVAGVVILCESGVHVHLDAGLIEFECN